MYYKLQIIFVNCWVSNGLRNNYLTLTLSFFYIFQMDMCEPIVRIVVRIKYIIYRFTYLVILNR